MRRQCDQRVREVEHATFPSLLVCCQHQQSGQL
ncbi:hypothetical protein GBAR_LOCUS14748 [Geodia barretti]|uniref:Uncharacterized protein n=1 Tax=Geodia barretti TaxID=519541 RepID=A0AA35SAJ2_GEOBA|nr:hypothetical protein GBAR_LOCUS14748 [Geodia barretti]